MEPVNIQSIDQLLSLAGLADLQHPLCHALRVETVSHLAADFPLDFSFAFYTIGLIHDLKGDVKCGRKSYDHQKGTMFFIGPDQLVGHALGAMKDATGWLLFFHQGYLANHHLREQLTNYGFFDYAIDEALHLSKKEEVIIEQLFENIHDEFQSTVDQHSKSVALSNLELILTYSNRAYNRQFITRNDVESSFPQRFDQVLNQYFKDHDLEDTGIPNSNVFAEQLNMSPKYLGDKLRLLTGKTAQEHIFLKITERAKVLLLQKEVSVAEVAYQMGFEYPQYFSRFFKKRVGLSPKAFQNLN